MWIKDNVPKEECDDANALANKIGQFIVDQHVTCDVVDGAMGVFLTNMLEQSNRDGFKLQFNDDSVIQVKLLPPNDKEIDDA